MEQLCLEDLLGVGRLKYLRNRTLRVSKRRDPDYLLRILTPSYLRWDPHGPLAGHLSTARNQVEAYRTRKQNDDREAMWLSVLNAVNDVIAEGERIQGHKIKPRGT